MIMVKLKINSIIRYFRSDPLYFESLSLSDLKMLAWVGFLAYPTMGVLLLHTVSNEDHRVWERWAICALSLVALLKYNSASGSREQAYRFGVVSAIGIILHSLYVAYLNDLSLITTTAAVVTFCVTATSVPTRGGSLLCLLTGVLGAAAVAFLMPEVSAEMVVLFFGVAAAMIFIVKTSVYRVAMALIYANEVKSVLKNILEFTMDSTDLSSTLSWAMQDLSKISWCRGRTLAIFVKKKDSSQYIVRNAIGGKLLQPEDYRKAQFHEVALAAGGKSFGYLFVSPEQGYVALASKMILLKAVAESLVLLIDAHFKAEEIERQRSMISHSAKMVSLGEMAGGIAHEINTPLATISIDAANLASMKESDRVHTKEFDAAIRKIELTVSRVAKVISGLRAFARDGNKDSLEPVALGLVFEDVLGLCLEKFKNHGVQLVQPSSQTHGVEVLCRRVQLGQVLLNLLSNAFDAVSGRASGAARCVRVEVVRAEAKVLLKVFDSGPGVSPEAQERLFQPFFTTKEIGKGTGLGLSISKGLMEDQGGRLFYDNQSKESCFVIELLAPSA
jgi:signal transduction histidine kinase